MAQYALEVENCCVIGAGPNRFAELSRALGWQISTQGCAVVVYTLHAFRFVSSRKHAGDSKVSRIIVASNKIFHIS